VTDRAERFPRTIELPSQSPIFWVEQKDRYLRQLLIRDVEELTDRRLVVCFANRFERGSDIDARDALYLTELLGDVGTDPLDILLETNGGQTDATEGLISTIQTLINDFRVVVANAAKSNGTLVALAARSIVMGATSELGPIEPMVNGIPSSILIQPPIAAQNYPLHMFGQYALQQSRALAKKLLSEGMMKGRSNEEIELTVQKIYIKRYLLFTRLCDQLFRSHYVGVDRRVSIPGRSCMATDLAALLYVRPRLPKISLSEGLRGARSEHCSRSDLSSSAGARDFAIRDPNLGAKRPPSLISPFDPARQRATNAAAEMASRK
jgi:hypothetical protein